MAEDFADWWDGDFVLPGQPMPAVGLLGETLRAARDQRLISQKQLAARANVGQSVVSRLERGQRQPSWSLFCRLLDALELEPVVSTRRKRSTLEKEIDELKRLSPKQRWDRAHVEAARLAEELGAIPELSGNWALDGDAALVGHGLPLQPQNISIAVRDDPALTPTIEQLRGGWWELELRLRPSLPAPLPMSADGWIIPVLPIDHVAPSSDEGVVALAAWAARVTLDG